MRNSALLLSLLLTMLCSAAALALPEDADQPINIQADSGQIDQKQRLATYEGNVRVDQGTLQVFADRMVVEYRDQKVVSITFTGAPARYGQQLERDAGRVTATAEQITYYTRNERLFLNGDALLIQEGNEIRGEEIRYDIVAGRIDAESTVDEPIRMTLQPDRGPAATDADAPEADRDR